MAFIFRRWPAFLSNQNVCYILGTKSRLVIAHAISRNMTSHPDGGRIDFLGQPSLQYFSMKCHVGELASFSTISLYSPWSILYLWQLHLRYCDALCNISIGNRKIIFKYLVKISDINYLQNHNSQVQSEDQKTLTLESGIDSWFEGDTLWNLLHHILL